MDHSSHAGHYDHSDHSDHSGHVRMDMDMGNSSDDGMGCMSTGHHGMGSMAFHWGYCETILFSQWSISTVGGLVGSMFGIVLMAAIYEGLKYYREYLFWRTYNSLNYRSMRYPASSRSSNEAEDNKIVQPQMLSWIHAYQTVLHVIQMVLAYFLMLIFMTYNVWLCIAVVVGAATGYFLFGWKKSVIVDVTEHCH